MLEHHPKIGPSGVVSDVEIWSALDCIRIEAQNFETIVFQEFFRLLGIIETRTTNPLISQSDGMVER